MACIEKEKNRNKILDQSNTEFPNRKTDDLNKKFE